MKKILKQILSFYYYIFYCIYRFWAFVNTTEWGAATRSAITILALEIWTSISILFYLKVKNVSDEAFYSVFGFLLLINLYLFILNDKWKPYFEKFRKYDKTKRLKLDIISWTIIIVLLINFIYSFGFYNK